MSGALQSATANFSENKPQLLQAELMHSWLLTERSTVPLTCSMSAHRAVVLHGIVTRGPTTRLSPLLAGSS
jgi:hypothetical protein